MTLTCDRLGTVSVMRFGGDLLVVSSGAPVPPGTRLVVSEAGSGAELAQGKVTSVSAVEGRWEVTVKLFAPSKAARQLLDSLADS